MIDLRHSFSLFTLSDRMDTPSRPTLVLTGLFPLTLRNVLAHGLSDFFYFYFLCFEFKKKSKELALFPPSLTCPENVTLLWMMVFFLI